MAGAFEDETVQECFKNLVQSLLQNQRDRALNMDAGCFERAQKRGEQTFTLVEQDRTSPETICFWIMKNIETCPAEKLVDALLDAIVMRENPNRKAAD